MPNDDDDTAATRIAEAVADVRARIAQACARSGRSPQDVLLVAVSKTVPPGRVRLACRKRMDEPGSCPNAMTYQDVYEEQIGAYLAAFQIPEDLQTRLLDAMRAIAPAVESPDQERRTLEARLERIKELYD